MKLGAANPIIGNIVAVKIIIEEEEPLNKVKSKIRKYCKDQLESFKLQVHVEIAEKKVSEKF